MRLDRTNAELKITQASLSSQESLNVVLQSTNEDLRRDIVGLESDIDDLEGEIDGLEDNVTILEVGKARLELTVQGLEAANSELTGERDEAISRGDALFVDKEQLTTDLAVSRNNNERLLETNAGLHSDLSEARAENDNLQASNRELSGDLETARTEYMALQSAVGTVEELQSTADGVRGEIVELEDMLRPLILSWDSRTTGGFFCTGSMEPTLGCLDSVTWITEFEPSMIVEGAVISFNPNCWETHADKDDVNTAHRVIDIKFEDDVYHFWPRGDGNEEDDGCWIPHGNVEGYAVEFFADTRPENAELRLAVLTARDVFREVRDSYDEAYTRYCGFSPYEGRTCYLSGSQYDETTSLWHAQVSALDVYSCWTKVAEQSEWPGHIPEHTCKYQWEADSV
ncbi:MAG: hypothetical protein J4G01_09575 [Dehalococcoidia bacterium]|nr:hypothetical protein [Dehalococcoidia bacterium]